MGGEQKVMREKHGSFLGCNVEADDDDGDGDDAY